MRASLFPRTDVPARRMLRGKLVVRARPLMIEIRSCDARTTLLTVPADSLVGRKFRGLKLPQADFANMLLSGCDFCHATLQAADFQTSMLEDSGPNEK